MNKINSNTFYLIILLIFILTLFLRIYKIDEKNLWFDEVYSWNISNESVKQIIETTSGDIHPPFYYFVLKSWNIFFGDSIISMRMLSVIFSMLSFILILILARKYLKDNGKIIIVLLLYAVSPLNIYYSQEVRMQNLNLFLCLGSVLFFLRFIKTNRNKDGILYSLFTILALYTHYFSFLILFTQLLLIIILYYKKYFGTVTIKKYFLFFLSINLFYIPWYPLMVRQISEGQMWRTPQSYMDVAHGLINFLKDIFMSSYIYYESSAFLIASTFFSLIFLILILYMLLRILNKNLKLRMHVFLKVQKDSLGESLRIGTGYSGLIIFSFFIIPLILAAIISLSQSMILSRYLSMTLPYLLTGVVYMLFTSFKKRTAYILISILLITSCYGAYINYDNNFKNNDYRKIITYLETNFNEGDKIIIEPHFNGWVINYHNLHNETNIKDPIVLGWNLEMQVDSLSKRDDLKNIWFILDYSSLEKSNYDSLFVYMKESGYERRSEKYFYPFPAKVKVEYYRR